MEVFKRASLGIILGHPYPYACVETFSSSSPPHFFSGCLPRRTAYLTPAFLKRNATETSASNASAVSPNDRTVSSSRLMSAPCPFLE